MEQDSYWKEGVPEYRPRAHVPPAKVDVAIVGAGYSGLGAAMHLARGGRSVAVFDADEIGFGCSSRNGGMYGPSFHKLGLAGLAAKYGHAKAVLLLQEGLRAVGHFEELIAAEGIDCDLQSVGRFRGAVSAASYDALARESELLGKEIGLSFHMVPAGEQQSYIGSAFYHGGVCYERDGGIHPRKLVQALARRAEDAGAQLFPHAAVTGLRRDGRGWDLGHAAGSTRAGEVVIATNGYSDRAANSMRRRIIPIRTSAAATEELPPALVRELTPGLRMHGEATRVFMWYRPSPDGRRMLFGGRLAPKAATPDKRRRMISAAAQRVFPQLEPYRIEHVWSGDVAYTLDHAPHLGKIDGVWHLGGYCGSGVTRSLYFAAKIARKILCAPDADTAFDDLPFKPVPMHAVATPIALAITNYHAWRDRRDHAKALLSR